MWLILVVTAHAAAPACAGVDFTAAEACDTRACLTAALGASCLASLDALEACPALAGCDSYDPVCDPQSPPLTPRCPVPSRLRYRHPPR